MNRLLTPKFEEAIKDYPLYSQDGKARDAVCVAIFTIGNIRWFVQYSANDACRKVSIAHDIDCGNPFLLAMTDIEKSTYPRIFLKDYICAVEGMSAAYRHFRIIEFAKLSDGIDCYSAI